MDEEFSLRRKKAEREVRGDEREKRSSVISIFFKWKIYPLNAYVVEVSWKFPDQWAFQFRL